jgi:hypothetical protein
MPDIITICVQSFPVIDGKPKEYAPTSLEKLIWQIRGQSYNYFPASKRYSENEKKNIKNWAKQVYKNMYEKAEKKKEAEAFKQRHYILKTREEKTNYKEEMKNKLAKGEITQEEKTSGYKMLRDYDRVLNDLNKYKEYMSDKVRKNFEKFYEDAVVPPDEYSENSDPDKELCKKLLLEQLSKAKTMEDIGECIALVLKESVSPECIDDEHWTNWWNYYCCELRLAKKDDEEQHGNFKKMAENILKKHKESLEKKLSGRKGY